MTFVSRRGRAFFQKHIYQKKTNQKLLNWVSTNQKIPPTLLFGTTFLFSTTFLLIFKKISLLHSYLVLLFFINFHVKFAPTLLFKPTSIFGTLEYMHSRISHERIEPWTTSIIPGLHEPIVLIIKVQIFWEGRKNLVHLPIFIWHYLVASNHKWKMVQVFVVFSEYPNFTLEQFEKAK